MLVVSSWLKVKDGCCDQREGGGVLPECQVNRNFIVGPKKGEEKKQQLKLICEHITVAAAAVVEEKPGNSNAGTFPAVTKSHSNENAARL